jgi:arylsulfatase A-like enzyme
MIGKWHLKSEPVGFDYWKVLPGQGHYYNPDFRTPEGMKRIQGYVTDIITDLSIEWLESGRDPSKPFMLMSQHKAPHRAWLPGPQHLTLFDGVVIPEPETLFDDYSGRASGAASQEMEIGKHLDLGTDLKVRPDSNSETSVKRWENVFGRMTPEQRESFNGAYQAENDAFLATNLQGDDLVRWKYQRYLRDYLRCIASVDDNIGRLLDYLDTSGLAENTVVMYSSDQGFYLGEHGWFDKRWMYEESLHMPFIVRWPGVIAPGSKNTRLVQNLDFAETFLDIAGVAIPSDMQGKSLVPLLEGQAAEDWRESIYYHYYEYPAVHMVQKHIGVRTDRHKLIYYYELGEWELFDLETDPHELNSVYENSEYSSTVEELKRELKRLQEYYKDNTVPPWVSDS